MRAVARLALLAACAIGIFGCGTSKVLLSNRPQHITTLGDPPYYKDYVKHLQGPADSARVLFLPVAVSPNLWQSDTADRDRLASLYGLADSMNAFLSGTPGLIGIEDFTAGDAPSVYVGLANSDYCPGWGKLGFSDSLAKVLCAEEGEPKWRAAVSEAAANAHADYVLVAEIGFAEFPTESGGLFRSNQLELGTGYDMSVGTAGTLLGDGRAEALEVVGVLLDGRGKILRAGGEGFLSVGPDIRLSQRFIIGTILDNASFLEARRKDLPSGARNWQVALSNLATQLRRGAARR